MRIVLSRKGMDASWGGCPSPILPDGRLVPLPIPEPVSERSHGVPYTALRVPGHRSAAALLRALGRDAVVHPAARCRGETGRRVTTPLDRAGAHLDPDLVAGMRDDRESAWRPAFGQVGGPQSHLAAQGVGPGDLFLFFGWFRATRREGGRLRWEGPDLHVLFGWLEIDEVVTVGEHTALGFSHPHLDGRTTARFARGNTLYLGTDRVSLAPTLPGAGTFPRLAPVLRLTAEGATRSVWDLPAALHPGVTPAPLSWHAADRWAHGPEVGRTTLRSAARGQEFVLGATEGVLAWVHEVLSAHG
jgi:hypothetical protein